MSQPIEIIGGGLAGLSLGLALRRTGVPVVLHEAGDYPRHRVCGEFITGLDEATVARLGLAHFLTDARRHTALAWFSGEHPLRTQILPAPALGLSRHALDARLAQAFVAAGGELHPRSRVDPNPSPPGRVFATGRRPGTSEWLGLKIHLRGYSPAHGLEVHLGRHAYVGIAGIEDGSFNLCGLFRRRPDLPPPENRAARTAFLLHQLEAAGLETLAARLRTTAEFDADSFCAVAAVNFSAPSPEPGRLCLGDTYAMIPPFTGNGMAMAFQSAELALDPLLAYSRGEQNWLTTCRTVQRRLHRQFRLRLSTAGSLHPFLHQPSRQRWLFAASRLHLLPLRSLYALLH